MTLSEERLDERRRGLGGSDMGAILGINPWRQSIDVFYDKRPDVAKENGWVPDVVEGDAVDFGHYVEEPIAQLYEKRTGLKVRKSHRHCQHKTCPWLLGNIDRKVQSMSRGLEIKSVNWRSASAWGQSGTDEIAPYYMAQVHHYMLVLDYPEWDVAALIGGATDFRIYHLERSKEWDELILDSARDFWLNHVEKGVPPALDLSHNRIQEVIKRAYNLIDGESVTLHDESVHWHKVRESAAKLESEYRKVKETATTHIQSLAENAAKIYIPGVPGCYVREKRKRAGHVVEPSEYIQFRYSSKMK